MWTWLLVWCSVLLPWMLIRGFDGNWPMSRPGDLQPLQPLPLTTIAQVAVTKEAGTGLHQHVPAGQTLRWTPDYDTLSITWGHPWQLQGNSKAWFGMDVLFRKLLQSSHTSVDIFHWGDSQIEGDRITGTLRASFQQSWGGHGVGWVLPRMPAPNFALASTDIRPVRRRAGFGRGRDASALRLPFFAVNDFPKGTPWEIGANPQGHVTNHGWTRTVVWSELDQPWTLEMSDRNRDPSASLDGISTWIHDPVHAPMVVTSPAENSTMLGVNLTSSTGVHIHNVPLRGNSGTLFDDVREEDWSTFKMLHNVGLVILQFGGNAVPSLGGEEAAKRYAKAIATNIRHIQGQMPGVPIVFIGPSDMGASPSDFPGLSAVVDALRDAVLSSDALFWDLQAVMGGPGSMATWMNTGLAGNDGIHFTPQGARLVGERLDAVLRQAGRNRVNTSREP